MLHITTEVVEALYETLRLTRPFRGWRLPPGDEVCFHVSGVESPMGLYFWNAKCTRHEITISARRHKTLRSTLETLAHEMVHLHEKQIGVRDDVGHGWQFRRMADAVCRHHGFDRGQF